MWGCRKQPQSALDAKHLVMMLGKALKKEREQWKPRVFRKTTTIEEVCEEHRNEAVLWLRNLNQHFQFSSESLGLAIAIFDQFLQLVKVRPKYLRCIAISCYYLAAKTLEEDEVIPSTTDLVRGSQSGCTVAEVCRMERLVLDKLNWNINFVTSVDFLHMIHVIMMKNNPHLLDGLSSMTPSQHISILRSKLIICLGHGSLMLFPPALLALALISLELEQFTSIWFPTIVSLQKMVQVDSKHLIHCREQVAQCLASKNHLQTSYRFSSLTRPKVKSNKRKVDLMAEEVDEIYDSIKRLYSEETVEEVLVNVRPSCSSEARQDPEEMSFAQIQAVSAT
ncbi:cyclin-I-like [Liolophura sinensis]|uniref:cyclin-I-like n=1 Tax=Liolophura sinensis TaxID=3198878 RepID=UPI0031592C34